MRLARILRQNVKTTSPHTSQLNFRPLQAPPSKAASDPHQIGRSNDNGPDFRHATSRSEAQESTKWQKIRQFHLNVQQTQKPDRRATWLDRDGSIQAISSSHTHTQPRNFHKNTNGASKSTELPLWKLKENNQDGVRPERVVNRGRNTSTNTTSNRKINGQLSTTSVNPTRTKIIFQNTALVIRYSPLVFMSCAESVAAFPLNPLLPLLLLRHRKRYDSDFQLLLHTSNKRQLGSKSTIRHTIRTRVRHAFYEVVKKDGITLGNAGFTSPGPFSNVGKEVDKDEKWKGQNRQVLRGTVLIEPLMEALNTPMHTLHEYFRIALAKIARQHLNNVDEMAVEPGVLVRHYEEKRRRYAEKIKILGTEEDDDDDDDDDDSDSDLQRLP